MLIYPQLIQYPVRKHRLMRTVTNRSADGRTVKLADPAGETTEWRLAYSDLSDAEIATLQQFFVDAEGSLQSFTFLDPTANLLAWSEKFDDPAWTKGPLLTVNGQQLTNTGTAPQRITQTLSGAPPSYFYSLSADVRATSPGTVTMVIGGTTFVRPVTPQWSRIACTATGDPTFGLELPAGATIEVFGIQTEAQAAPSTYKPATQSGVHEGARFRDDTLSVMTTGVNRHNCTVKIIHANHL